MNNKIVQFGAFNVAEFLENKVVRLDTVTLFALAEERGDIGSTQSDWRSHFRTLSFGTTTLIHVLTNGLHVQGTRRAATC